MRYFLRGVLLPITAVVYGFPFVMTLIETFFRYTYSSETWAEGWAKSRDDW